MATPAADRLSLQHQRDLATLVGGVTSGVASTALGADPTDIDTWYWAAVDGLLARIAVGYAQARQSAMQFLPRHAAMSGAGSIRMVPGSLDTEALRTSLRVTGPVAFKTAVGAGHDTDYALRSMSSQMAGAAERFTRAGDRDLVERTAEHGDGLVGWRRRLGARACGFCAMLASRGAVYTSRERAVTTRSGTRYHDHCRCWTEPLYAHEEEPPEVRDLQRQWQQVTARATGDEKLRAWRRHWEQATPTVRRRYGLTARPPEPAYTVRPSLATARSAEDVSRVLADEIEALTGRRIPVDLRGSVQTAREHAEGVLRTMERYPDVAIDEIATDQLGIAYAEYQPEARRLVFDRFYSSLEHRHRYLKALAEDKRTGWHPYDSPTGLAIHEMGHALDIGQLRGAAHPMIDDLIEARGGVKAAGREISEYAMHSREELIAEAFADVLTNGPQASALSRQIVDLLDIEYRAGARGTLADAAPLRSVPRTPGRRIDRTKSPEQILEQERAEKARALAAPGIKLEELVASSPGGAAAKALLWYQRFGDEWMNFFLRRGRMRAARKGERSVPTQEKVEASIAKLDELMAESRLAEDIIVYRGIPKETIRRILGDPGEPGSLVGREFADKGFMSTSADRFQAGQFMAGEGWARDGIMLEIRVPEGTGAIQVSNDTFTGRAATAGKTSEREILLERGLRLRVVSDEWIPDPTTGRPYRHVVVEVVPARPAKAAKTAKTTGRQASARDLVELDNRNALRDQDALVAELAERSVSARAAVQRVRAQLRRLRVEPVDATGATLAGTQGRAVGYVWRRPGGDIRLDGPIPDGFDELERLEFLAAKRMADVALEVEERALRDGVSDALADVARRAPSADDLAALVPVQGTARPLVPTPAKRAAKKATKAAAPKAPSSPYGKMTAAQLRAEAKARGVADLAEGMTAPKLRALLSEMDNPQVAARRVAEAAKRAADRLATAEATLRRALKVPAGEAVDPAALRRAIAAAKKAGVEVGPLKKVGTVSKRPVKYDPAVHSLPDGVTVPAGAKVRVVEPGYTATVLGEPVVVRKATVEVIEAPAPKKTTRRAAR